MARSASNRGRTEVNHESVSRFVESHGMPGRVYDKGVLDSLGRLIDKNVPGDLIVIAADIRKSTALMRESVSFKEFAKVMGEFVSESRRIITEHDGWFDKFTGDGFLAYWIVPRAGGDDVGDREVEMMKMLFQVCHGLLYHFQTKYYGQFRANCMNFPEGVGLSIGLDRGMGYLATVANDTTIVGPPVVGAVRMVSAASEPWETCCNVFYGEMLYGKKGYVEDDFEVVITREFVATKEYGSQEAYKLAFNRSVGVLKTRP